MGAVSNFFAQFDLFQAPSFLRINKGQKMKSFPIGLASFLISCIFIYISITSCLSILNYQSIQSTMQDTFIPQDSAKGQIKTLAIGINNLTIEEIDTMFRFETRWYQADWLPAPISMVACTPQKWLGLGEGYSQKFYEYQLDRCYCLNTTESHILKQTQLTKIPTIFAIFITICVPWPLPTICNMTKSKKYINENNLQIYIRLLDTGFTPEQKVSNYQFINTDHKVYGISQVVQILLSTYRIEHILKMVVKQKKAILLCFDTCSTESMIGSTPFFVLNLNGSSATRSTRLENKQFLKWKSIDFTKEFVMLKQLLAMFQERVTKKIVT